jgi:hypothetical protein
METRLKLVLFVRSFWLCMLPQEVLIAFIIIIYHVDHFCAAFNMVLAVCQYLPNITLISTVLLFSDLPRPGQDPCLGWCNVHKMGSTYPICMNWVSPDSLWCQESYILASNVFYAQNDYFWSFWGMGSKMMTRVQLLCAEYVVKYGHSSTKLWHSCTRRIKRISERYHLSRLSHFWRSYGDVTVVSVGVLNGLFDMAPLKWVKTWRTTHATNIKLKYTSTDGTSDNVGSFLTESWLFNDGFFERNSFFSITSSVYMIAQQVLL